MLQDLRIGLRILKRERGFSILAVTVLALGICGVTTMFSVVNGVMLRGFSFPNADRRQAHAVRHLRRLWRGVACLLVGFARCAQLACGEAAQGLGQDVVHRV
jgi:hypothetical protein